MVTQWLHVSGLRGWQMPVIYNADCPLMSRLSAYTRTGTVVTSRLFHREWSPLCQQNAERTTSEAAQRASLACLLWLWSTADSSVSQTRTETSATASSYGQRDRVSPSLLHLHPLLQFKLQPIHGTQILSSGVWVRHFWSVGVLTVRAMSLRCRIELCRTD